MHLSILALLVAAVVAEATPAALAPGTVMAAVIERNRDLRSYEASVTTSFRQKTFPFVRLTLKGTEYFQAPSRCTILYSKLPGYMHGFPDAYAAMLNVPAWPQEFTIASAPGRVVAGHEDLALRLAPRDPRSAVVRGEIFVDPSTWTVDESDWELQGNVHFAIEQTFEDIGHFHVLASQQFTIQVPHTRAEGNSTFSAYRMNVAIDDSVFAGR